MLLASKKVVQTLARARAPGKGVGDLRLGGAGVALYPGRSLIVKRELEPRQFAQHESQLSDLPSSIYLKEKHKLSTYPTIYTWQHDERTSKGKQIFPIFVRDTSQVGRPFGFYRRGSGLKTTTLSESKRVETDAPSQNVRRHDAKESTHLIVQECYFQPLVGLQDTMAG